jgi:hypothetical protein
VRTANGDDALDRSTARPLDRSTGARARASAAPRLTKGADPCRLTAVSLVFTATTTTTTRTGGTGFVRTR